MQSRPLLWVIQDHPSSKNPLMLADACSAADVACVRLTLRDDELPDIAASQRSLFWGSCRFIEHALSAHRWQPCAYFDAERLCFSDYRRRYGAQLLNHDARVLRLAAAVDEVAPGEKVFVRSDSDMKELAGSVWSGAELRRYADGRRAAGDTATLDLQVVVASRKRIDLEWRVFLVDGRFCAGSQYRSGGELAYARSVPREVVAFAEALASVWSPLPVFTLDVASCGTELFLLELNGFNSSGFYAADVAALVRTVSEYALRSTPRH